MDYNEVLLAEYQSLKAEYVEDCKLLMAATVVLASESFCQDYNLVRVVELTSKDLLKVPDALWKESDEKSMGLMVLVC